MGELAHAVSFLFCPQGTKSGAPQRQHEGRSIVAFLVRVRNPITAFTKACFQNHDTGATDHVSAHHCSFSLYMFQHVLQSCVPMSHPAVTKNMKY
jgi:hypothetical protein